MKIKNVYLLLCFLGTIIPYASFSPWLITNGLNLPLLVNQISSSAVASFGWLDVLLSATALFVMIYTDSHKRKVQYWWLIIIGTITVGVSLGLPLYLYLREISKPNEASFPFPHWERSIGDQYEIIARKYDRI